MSALAKFIHFVVFHGRSQELYLLTTYVLRGKIIFHRSLSFCSWWGGGGGGVGSGVPWSRGD